MSSEQNYIDHLKSTIGLLFFNAIKTYALAKNKQVVYDHDVKEHILSNRLMMDRIYTDMILLIDRSSENEILVEKQTFNSFLNNNTPYNFNARKAPFSKKEKEKKKSLEAFAFLNRYEEALIEIGKEKVKSTGKITQLEIANYFIIKEWIICTAGEKSKRQRIHQELNKNGINIFNLLISSEYDNEWPNLRISKSINTLLEKYNN